VTQNQVAYLNYLENKRSNQAQEMENRRHNLEQEEIQRQQTLANERSSLRTMYSNMMNTAVGSYHQSVAEEELHRYHNVSAILEAASLELQKRDVATRESSLANTIRHNRVEEAISTYKTLNEYRTRVGELQLGYDKLNESSRQAENKYYLDEWIARQQNQLNWSKLNWQSQMDKFEVAQRQYEFETNKDMKLLGYEIDLHKNLFAGFLNLLGSASKFDPIVGFKTSSGGVIPPSVNSLQLIPAR